MRVPTTLRQPLWLRLIGTSLLCALAAILLGMGPVAGGTTGLLSGTGGILTLGGAIRYWLQRIDVTDTGVRVVNQFQTYSLNWDAVERVGSDDGLWIRCRDGRVIHSSAFAEVPDALPMVAERNRHAARELEAVRKRHRS